MADEMDKVAKLLQNHLNLSLKESDSGKSKVVCQLTSHEMPCTVKAVVMYVNGKKYKQACEHQLTTDEKELCSQYLLEKRRGQLYCTLTKKYINNLPHHIRQHLNGQRFRKAMTNSKTQTTNLSHEKLREQEMESNRDMWSPSDSESESAETEELDPEFKKEEKLEEDSYSFDVLDSEEKPVEDDIDIASNPTCERQEPRKKLKRSAKHLKKSTRKSKNRNTDSNEIPKKKRKKTS